MNTPTKITRKPNGNIKNLHKANMFRCKSDKNSPICYISPTCHKKYKEGIEEREEIEENLNEVINKRIMQQNKQLKIIIKSLHSQITLLLEQNVTLKAKTNQENSKFSKSKAYMETMPFNYNPTQIKFKYIDKQFIQDVQLKNYASKKSINYQCQKHEQQILKLSKDLKQTRKEISKLQIQLNSVQINKQIAENRLAAKQKMLMKLKYRQQQKQFNDAPESQLLFIENQFGNTCQFKGHNFYNQRIDVNDNPKKLKICSQSTFSEQKQFSLIQQRQQLKSTMSDLRNILNLK